MRYPWTELRERLDIHARLINSHHEYVEGRSIWLEAKIRDLEARVKLLESTA